MEKGPKSPGAQDVTAALTQRRGRGQGRVKVTVAGIGLPFLWMLFSLPCHRRWVKCWEEVENSGSRQVVMREGCPFLKS